MRNIHKHQPRCFGGSSFAFVAQGYPSTINSKAKNLRDNGYTYRIVSLGRERVLYVGPKRKGRVRVKKSKKLKRKKKDKKSK